MTAQYVDIDRARLQALTAAELRRFADAHATSRALYERARGSLLGGVPMTWMNKWAGGHPLFMREASGARITDVDGNTYVDLCLGDTGSMPGHGPAPIVDALAAQAARGITTMLPSEDAIWAGEELARRFGLPFWSFTTSATDANRFALRIARQITGRPRVLVFNYCYHGSVDEAVVTLDAHGRTVGKPGSVGPAVDPATTTVCVEWNDVDALERALAPGDVAVVLAEPALTNIGIVPPAPGYHDALRALTRRNGTLLHIDETHTISAGPGGCTARWGLEPDLITVGKAIAGGVPTGAYGLTAALAERVLADDRGDYIDVGGVGGTLAGNALQMAGVRATLGEVLTADAFVRTEDLCTRYVAGIRATLERTRVPWTIEQLGCRAEWRFTAPAPTNGGQSAAAHDEDLDVYTHLALLNRGVLLTPFHAMALFCPASTTGDVDQATAAFAEVVDALTGA
jgi:glutamate-1-semialdehyde 2,1-aminomutase